MRIKRSDLEIINKFCGINKTFIIFTKICSQCGDAVKLEKMWRARFYTAFDYDYDIYVCSDCAKTKIDVYNISHNLETGKPIHLPYEAAYILPG